MKVTEITSETWKYINSINNWDDESFDWDKAYVSSIFSKIAYLHISEYELKNTERANLIPCAEYREIVESGIDSNLSGVLTNFDLENFFVVERPNAIAVVVKITDVIFVSMRGTQQLYDWLVNLNVMKSRPYPNKDIDIFFHKGFHKATASCIGEIYTKIEERYGNDSKVYVTGH